MSPAQLVRAHSHANLWVCLRLWPEERSQPLTRRAGFQFQIFYHSLRGGREDGNPFTLSLLVCVMGSAGLLLRGAEVGGAEGSAWHVARLLFWRFPALWLKPDSLALHTGLNTQRLQHSSQD